MDYETVVGVLRQIAQPIDYTSEDETDPMTAVIAIMGERGWDVAAQCVMTIRYQMLMPSLSSRPSANAWYATPPPGAAEPAAGPAAAGDSIDWGRYVDFGIANNDSAPFCEAVSAGHLQPELAFVLAAGVGTKISSADTLAFMWRRCATYATDLTDATGGLAARATAAASAAGVPVATRVMYEAMVEAVGLAAGSARGVLSLPPVLV